MLFKDRNKRSGVPFYWNVILRFVCLVLNDNYEKNRRLVSGMIFRSHITLRLWLEDSLLFFRQRFFEITANDLFSINKDMLIFILIWIFSIWSLEHHINTKEHLLQILIVWSFMQSFRVYFIPSNELSLTILCLLILIWRVQQHFSTFTSFVTSENSYLNY